MDACYELYGERRDLGKHGQKYSASFKSLDPENEGNSTPNRLGSVHVPVYKSTGNVMAQGICYLLWHAEHLPHLLQSIRPETPASWSALEYKPESPALNIENESDSNENFSVCDLGDTDFMLECDACKLWMHYACSKVFPESRLQELTSERRSVFVCWQCESVPIPAIAPPPLKDDASHTSEAETAPDTQNSYAKSHEAIIAAISSMERNITDSMISVINEKSSVLNDKFNAELSALANKHKLQVASLESQIGELKKDNKRYGESLCTERNAHQLEVDAQQEKINLLSERLQISKEALTKSNNELVVTKKKLAETQADLESKFTKISELTSRNQELMFQLQATQKDLWETRKGKADSNPPPTQRLTPDTSTPEHPISDHRPNIRKDSDNAAPPTATATREDDPVTDTASTNVSALPTSTMPGPQSDEPNNKSVSRPAKLSTWS